MIDTKLELAKALDTYIKEKHTQEECTGFIDGFEKADTLFAKRIVGVTLPNIYEGSLNSKRIKEIDTIAETYTCDSSTIRRVFCDGADWYKKQLKDNGN